MNSEELNVRSAHVDSAGGAQGRAPVRAAAVVSASRTTNNGARKRSRSEPLTFESTASGPRSSAKPAAHRDGANDVASRPAVDVGGSGSGARDSTVPRNVAFRTGDGGILLIDTATPAQPHRLTANLHAGAPGDDDAWSDDDATPRPDYIRYPGSEICINPWGRISKHLPDTDANPEGAVRSRRHRGTASASNSEPPQGAEAGPTDKGTPIAVRIEFGPHLFLRRTLSAAGIQIARLAPPAQYDPAREPPPGRAGGAGDYFSAQCASLRIPVPPANIGFTLRAYGIDDPTLTAAALGTTAQELAAAIEWTRHFRDQGRELSDHPFAQLPVRPAHIWAATLAHCLARTNTPLMGADVFPRPDRLLHLAIPDRLSTSALRGPYIERVQDEEGRPANFTRICAAIDAADPMPSIDYGQIHDTYRLNTHGDDLRDEQRAAVRWATWLNLQTPECMAGHIMFLHAEDMRTITHLARSALVAGRRGATSLHGILVRAIYHALVEFILNISSVPGCLPARFPCGPDYRQVEWIMERGNSRHQQSWPPLCAGEALAIIERFGDAPHISGHFPRQSGDSLLLVPAATTFPRPDNRGECPLRRHIHPSTWEPERYYARNDALWPIVCHAARLWCEAQHLQLPTAQPSQTLRAMKHYFFAMVAGTRGGPSHLPAEQSAAALALIRIERMEDPVSIAASLRRADAFLTEIGESATLAPVSTAQARQAPRPATPADPDTVDLTDTSAHIPGTGIGLTTQYTDSRGDSPGVLTHFVSLQLSVAAMRRTMRPRRRGAVVRIRGSTIARQMGLITNALEHLCAWMCAREASHLDPESSSDIEEFYVTDDDAAAGGSGNATNGAP
jgi:hypothetical protein